MLKRMSEGEMLAQLHEADALPIGVISKSEIEKIAKQWKRLYSRELFFCEIDPWRKGKVFGWGIKRE